jgi:hypothetical protein
MIIAVAVFIFGRYLYKITPLKGNMLVRVASCIGVSKSTKFFDLIVKQSFLPERNFSEMEGEENQSQRKLAGLC